MDKDLVSVIMPSYNTAKYIGDSIKSVQNQTYKNWELIIVDDCSTDSTDVIISNYIENDKRIKYLKNKTNCGAAICRNKAIREAKGRWIAFLDSDDLWNSEKLEKQLKFMKKNNYQFTYTCYEEINENGKKTGIYISGPKCITKLGMFNYCWVGCLTVMYDVQKIGLIQIENIKKNNDYALWLKICKKSNCYLLNESLALYRKGRKNSISNHSTMTMIKWHYRLFRNAEKQNAIFSSLNTIRNLVFGCYKKIKYVKNVKR